MNINETKKTLWPPQEWPEKYRPYVDHVVISFIKENIIAYT